VGDTLLVRAAVENLESRDLIFVFFDEFLERLHQMCSPVPAILGNSRRQELVFADGVNDLLEGSL
jgi:hypothetical protein